jgi:hypothetical protein
MQKAQHRVSVQSSGIHFQGDGAMISSDVLKAAEEKMDALFSAYSSGTGKIQNFIDI